MTIDTAREVLLEMLLRAGVSRDDLAELRRALEDAGRPGSPASVRESRIAAVLRDAGRRWAERGPGAVPPAAAVLLESAARDASERAEAISARGLDLLEGAGRRAARTHRFGNEGWRRRAYGGNTETRT